MGCGERGKVTQGSGRRTRRRALPCALVAGSHAAGTTPQYNAAEALTCASPGLSWTSVFVFVLAPPSLTTLLHAARRASASQSTQGGPGGEAPREKNLKCGKKWTRVCASDSLEAHACPQSARPRNAKFELGTCHSLLSLLCVCSEIRAQWSVISHGQSLLVSHAIAPALGGASPPVLHGQRVWEGCKCVRALHEQADSCIQVCTRKAVALLVLEIRHG